MGSSTKTPNHGAGGGAVTLKLFVLVAIWPPTDTVIFPVVAPVGTPATIIVVVGVPVIDAIVPLNFTMLFAAVVLKLVPLTVTVVPTKPLDGVKEVIEGEGAFTVNWLELVAIWPATSTVIFPVVAPVGTTATILVAVGVPVIVATVPLNFTMLLDGVVLKFVPVIVTDVPTTPMAGVKLRIVGEVELTVKLVALVAVCPPTVTVIVPLVAPIGTEVVMLVAVLAVTTAVTLLNLTILLLGVVLKFVPVIVMDEPTAPLVGLKLVMVGEVVIPTEKSTMLVAICPPTATVIFPVVAPDGTVAVILVLVGVPVMVAIVPLNLTILLAGIVLKFSPMILTTVPVAPVTGLMLLITGKLETTVMFVDWLRTTLHIPASSLNLTLKL